MLITERKCVFFKSCHIYFFDEPFFNYTPICDVVTYHTYKNRGIINGFDRIHCLTTTIDLSQDTDLIWNKIKRQHKRHIIRAEKNRTQVMMSDNYKGFNEIYKKFHQKKNYTNLFGLNVFPLQFIKKYGKIFIAENQDEILAGSLFFHDDQNSLLISMPYKIFGNSIDKNKLISDANCLIQWEAIQYFKNLGITTYDFGGLGNSEKIHPKYGLDYYKRSFGGDVISQYDYVKFNSRYKKLLFHFAESFNPGFHPRSSYNH
jgi:lipid II:glycine glycyltransferase (peptidoglycan interpeptide bridge formation enzyme)